MKAAASSNRETRHRVDIDSRSKLVIDDLLERGLYHDQQAVVAAAIMALQLKLANDQYTSEYDHDDAQAEIDELQLAPEDQ